MGTLVPMTEQHLEPVLAWRNDPRVRSNMYSQHEITLDEHRAWWNSARKQMDRRYFIYHAEGRDLGFVSITDIDQTHGTANWAYFSATDAPKGTGSGMERAALEMAFKVLGLRKLCCVVLDFNTRVIEFHKRFGFRIEGTLRSHKLIGKRYCDVVLMALFADSWRESNSSEKTVQDNGNEN